MPRFIIEELMTADFLKNLVDNPCDRAQELRYAIQEAGLTLEERYFVVGENKLIDIVSGDSDDVQDFPLAAPIERSSHILHHASDNNLR